MSVTLQWSQTWQFKATDLTLSQGLLCAGGELTPLQYRNQIESTMEPLVSFVLNTSLYRVLNFFKKIYTSVDAVFQWSYRLLGLFVP